MRIALAAVFFILAGAAFDTAKADPYRWCALYAGGDLGGIRSCYFMTTEQCLATISGLGGSCIPNPHFTGAPEAATAARRVSRPRS